MSTSVVAGRPWAAASTRPGWPRITLWLLVLGGLGAAIALPEPWQLALGAVALIVTIVAFVQPLWVLPLLLLAVPFGSFGRPAATSGEGMELGLSAADLLIALLAAGWLARGVRRRRITLAGGLPVVAVGAMIGLAALSIGYAGDRAAATKETLKWLELLLAMVIVVDVVRDRRAALVVVGALLAAGGAEAAFGVLQFATGAGPEQFALQGALRAFGHFEQPNPFAGYLTTSLPLAGVMALSTANSVRVRLFALGAGGLILVGVALSQSRGAWLGALTAAVCLLLMWGRATRRLFVPGALAVGLLVALAVSGVLPASILDRLGQTLAYFGVFDVRTVEASAENWAVVERMAHWQAGWYMFLDHPWLGVGAGNYAYAYPRYYVGNWPEALGHAHNYYLNMLAELGFVGGCLLLALLGLVFVRLGPALVRVGNRPDQTFWRPVLGGAVGGLVVFSVHNLFDSLFVHSVNVQIGVLLGLGLVAASHLTRACVSNVAA
ncbi:MAG: O-antigen ligase family protein [Chloroflexota bacterium]|nr:O-antigen ligase family protein [Chloroflexota bacterium]